MTVITMPSAEKKSDNVPLVNNIEIDPAAQAKDLEAGIGGSERSVRSRFLVLRVINDRVYSLWAVVYILLMSLLITIMMLYGEHIYKTIGKAFSDENDNSYGSGNIGNIGAQDKLSGVQDLNNDYDLNESSQLNDLKKFEEFSNQMNTLNSQIFNSEFNNDDALSEFKSELQEQVEDNYEKIVSNSARFIHDFSANVTGIVDVTGKRCFIMPLNRTAVTPPKSLYDLLFKMSSGYYAVDTSNIMHNMHVVKPAIEDLTPFGIYIAKDCANYPTFKLEKITSGVFKRSVLSGGKTFTNVDSYNIVNYHETDII